MPVEKQEVQVILTSGGLPSSRLTDSVFAYGYGTITEGSSTVYVGDAANNQLQINSSAPSIGEEVPEFEEIDYDVEKIRKEEML